MKKTTFTPPSNFSQQDDDHVIVRNVFRIGMEYAAIWALIMAIFAIIVMSIVYNVVIQSPQSVPTALPFAKWAASILLYVGCFWIFRFSHGIHVSMDGIKGPRSFIPIPFLDTSVYCRWGAIRDAREESYCFMRMLVGYDRHSNPTLFIPADLNYSNEFVALVKKLAPDDHPLNLFFKKNPNFFRGP